ncbi:hypothetical protein DL764_007494 [Monosporascus ibericus]|uniref:Uncharacterized protein n=1 Tax=Monosporascus ibericus TaxID=155417 RepID=A0A4Q4T0C5_9PEZI|nr:hypothetical protein DL764_007494 [Monosporascus ibericus]
MTAIDTDMTEVKRMFDVNVFGPMRMVHHFHDMVIKAAGTVVNIGSVGGIVPVKVLTVISGNIGTNILKSDASRRLPQNTTDRFQYAKNVVYQSQRSSPPTWFWYGNTTWLDLLMWQVFDFGKLRRMHNL